MTDDIAKIQKKHKGEITFLNAKLLAEEVRVQIYKDMNDDLQKKVNRLETSLTASNKELNKLKQQLAEKVTNESKKKKKSDAGGAEPPNLQAEGEEKPKSL